MSRKTLKLVKTAPETSTDGLAEATAAWLGEVEREYELDGHHRKLLVLAGRAWDRAEASRRVLDAEGLTYVDRFRQPKERPEVAIERTATNTFRLLVRELGLDLPGPGERSPRLGGR